MSSKGVSLQKQAIKTIKNINMTRSIYGNQYERHLVTLSKLSTADEGAVDNGMENGKEFDVDKCCRTVTVVCRGCCSNAMRGRIEICPAGEVIMARSESD